MYRQALSFDDILLVPRYSDLESRQGADVSSFEYRLPLVMAPMDMVTSPAMIKFFLDNQLMATVHRYFKTPEDQLDYVKDLDFSKIYFAVGSAKKWQYWIDYLIDHGVVRFMVDMAHGDTKLCTDTVSYICTTAKNKLVKVIAGNVATKSGFERLQEAGAHGIRVGIGSGSICSTRLNTGFGVPQFTAVSDCAKYKYPDTILISDGGIKHPGDMAKAIAAGADMCMIGKLLAGTNLAPGHCYDSDKQIVDTLQDHSQIKYKSYRGMASKEARDGILSYASIEGVSGLTEYLGTTENFMNDMELNLKASLSYAGVTNWVDFRRKVKIIEVSTNVIMENSTRVEKIV